VKSLASRGRGLKQPVVRAGPLRPGSLASRGRGLKLNRYVSNSLSAYKARKLVTSGDKGWALTPAGKEELAKREKAS
jgi:hypothetical protein